VSDAVALLVLLTAAQISEPTAVALERAARDVLGADASIILVRQQAPVADEAALEQAREADGVVEVSWDAEHRAAQLHCYLARDGRWLDRTITFDRDDADSERGRLLGFAIGSMLVGEKEMDARASASVAAPSETMSKPRIDTEPRAPERTIPKRWLELTGSATTGVQGSADALGVSLGLRFRIGASFRFVTGVEGSFGEIEEAQATRVFVAGRLGLAWQPYETSALGDFGLGLRTEGFAGWLAVTHLSEDDPAPDRQSRILGGARALVELGLGLSETASAFVGLGSVVVAGQTDVYTHGTLATTIPVVWLTAEIGVRTAF
jgi:opacity protein-like surface antigen